MILELILFLLLLLFYAVVKDRKPKSMPPGPFEIPFLGNAPLETVNQMKKLREKYGPIFTTRIGRERQVCIADYDLAKEAMASAECSDRPPMFKLFAVDPKVEGGVIGSNGIHWLHDRRFVLRHLRDLGMGKSHLEVAINKEAEMMVDFFKKFDGKPQETHIHFRRIALNVIWQLVSAKRYPIISNECDKIFDVFEKFRDQSAFLVFTEAFFPIVKIIPEFIKSCMVNTKIMDEFRCEIIKLLNETVSEHEKTLDEENSRDLTDDYLIAMKKSNTEEFNVTYLYQILSDLFAAGSDTVSNMLRWTVFFMVKYPDALKKVQEEIDREVPGDRLVSLDDKPRLPYLEAFNAETFRVASLVLMVPQRYTNNDFNIAGFTIPKGTAVTADAYFIHHDPKFWEKPEQFKPERFLDENGKFKAKLGRTFAFGSGKRECIGISLAMMEFFLFSSALFQNFTIELPKGEKLDDVIVETLGQRTTPIQAFIYKYRKP